LRAALLSENPLKVGEMEDLNRYGSSKIIDILIILLDLVKLIADEYLTSYAYSTSSRFYTLV